MVDLKEIKFTVALNAWDFPCEVEEECIDNDISIHYQDGSCRIDWTNDKYLPEMQKWLVETYGEDIKKYKSFAISAT